MNNAFHPRLNLPPSETVSQFENSEDGGKLQTYFGRKQRCDPYIRFVRHSKWESFMFISLRRLIATQSLEGEERDCRPVLFRYHSLGSERDGHGLHGGTGLCAAGGRAAASLHVAGRERGSAIDG